MFEDHISQKVSVHCKDLKGIPHKVIKGNMLFPRSRKKKKMTNITLITEQDRTACSVNSKSHPEKVHPQFYFEWTGKRGNCLHCSQYGESATLLLLNVVCLDTIFPKVCKKFCLCFYFTLFYEIKVVEYFLFSILPSFIIFFYRQGILF